jgi:acetolactate synthase-1/3 small subunit
VATDSLTVEITGDEDKIDSILKLLRGFGVKEVARTGRIAMLRGSTSQLSVEEKTSKTRKGGYNLL